MSIEKHPAGLQKQSVAQPPGLVPGYQRADAIEQGWGTLPMNMDRVSCANCNSFLRPARKVYISTLNDEMRVAFCPGCAQDFDWLSDEDRATARRLHKGWLSHTKHRKPYTASKWEQACKECEAVCPEGALVYPLKWQGLGTGALCQACGEALTGEAPPRPEWTESIFFPPENWNEAEL